MPVTTSIPPQNRIYPDPACTVPNYCKLTDEEKAALNTEIRRKVDNHRTVYISGLPAEFATPNPNDCNEKIVVPEPQLATYQLNSVICPVSNTALSESTLPPPTTLTCGANCYSTISSGVGSTSQLVSNGGYHVVGEIAVDVVRVSNGEILQSVVYKYDTRILQSDSQNTAAPGDLSVGIRAPFTVNPFINQGFAGSGGSPCNVACTNCSALNTPVFIPRIVVSTYGVFSSGISHRSDSIRPYEVPCSTNALVGLTNSEYRYTITGFNVDFIPIGTQQKTCEAPGYNSGIRYSLDFTLQNRVVYFSEPEANYVEGVDDPLEFTGAYFVSQNTTHYGRFGGIRWIPSGQTNPWRLQYFALANASAVEPTWNTLGDFANVSRVIVRQSASITLNGTTVPIPVEVGNPNAQSCTGGSFSQGGSAGSAIVYRNNQRIDSSWSGSGTLSLQSGEGTLTVSQAYPAVYHTPLLTTGSISNIKRMNHLNVHFWNPPEFRLGDERQVRDANVTVITDYGYDDLSASPQDVYGLNSTALDDLELYDKQNVEYLNLKVPLQGSAYGYQMGIWNVDEKSWALDGYEFTFTAYDEWQQKHRRD